MAYRISHFIQLIILLPLMRLYVDYRPTSHNDENV